MTAKKKVGSKPARRPQPVGIDSWTSTSRPELEDELLDLTISIRFTLERQRR